ncbi:hypothetical protein AVEN_178061-1 [Araneus ventricosus]|uniref:Uncharacterized protein n=1 Tax=Araneus ventricosus TaxID=182803 RepID=A0A4Y2I3R0_ARAVE|nr:hypothetical protein AVEN_178061-1 [Araneus ventricosus]
MRRFRATLKLRSYGLSLHELHPRFAFFSSSEQEESMRLVGFEANEARSNDEGGSVTSSVGQSDLGASGIPDVAVSLMGTGCLLERLGQRFPICGARTAGVREIKVGNGGNEKT